MNFSTAKRRIAAAGLIAGGLISLACNAADQLPKRGSYAGTFGWYFQGTVSGDDAHSVWGGAGTGAFRNDAGSGFLHGALVVCTAAGVSRREGHSDDRGECVATDRDGDRAFATWKCTKCPSIGEFQWTGGTGKYAGLKGRNSYQNNYAGPAGSPAGWAAWKGEWELP
jgi:hypothetical protein